MLVPVTLMEKIIEKTPSNMFFSVVVAIFGVCISFASLASDLLSLFKITIAFSGVLLLFISIVMYYIENLTVGWF